MCFINIFTIKSIGGSCKEFKSGRWLYEESGITNSRSLYLKLLCHFKVGRTTCCLRDFKRFSWYK
jgi:hypothetical protein